MGRRGWAKFLVAAVLTLSGLAGLSAAWLGAFPEKVAAEEDFITVASTTSTENSGLFAHILPLFEAAEGIKVRVIAVGTGQAIRTAQKGDADVLFVHHRPSEEEFVAAGYGLQRHEVMYNDFVIVGPRKDPAGIGGLADAAEALRRIAAAQAPFASRGDDSGTHKKERSLWHTAGIDVAAASGTWYRETGSGMGATLNTAAAMSAYAISDRATWIAFGNKKNLEILAEGDARLFNPYGVILVNPQHHPHVKAKEGQAFIDWLVSAEGQHAIARYRRNGRQLFYPSAAGS